MTHPSPKRNMIPKAVLMRSGLVSLATARPVNTAQPRTIVKSARPMTNVFNKAHSTIRRLKVLVNTAKPKSILNAVKGNQVNAVKASACWGNSQMDLQDQGVIDSGCSRHMTWNMSYLTNFEEIDGGYVAFGGNSKGGKIIGRCTIKTVPRKNNMYSVDLKNIVTKGGLTCLFAKATSDESKLWHRRLGHINFKTMNKLVKGNLVRGNQSNGNAGTKTCDDACKARMETVPGKYYIMLPLWLTDLLFSQNSKSSPDAGFKPLVDNEKKVTEELGKEGGDSNNNQEKEDDNLQVKQKEDGIFISQDKYVTQILKKFGFTDVKTASTPMETQNILLKDEDVCACARYQVNPKISHLHAVKRIFRHNLLPLLKVNAVRHNLLLLLKVNATRHNLQLLVNVNANEESEGFKQIMDFLNAHSIKHALTVNPTVYTSCVEQFWATVKAKIVNREVQLQSLVDGKKIIITEASARSDLQLDDDEGTDCMPNATISEELTRIGAKTTAWNEFSSTMASATICLATNQRSRRPKRKDTEIPQSSGPTNNVADEAVNKEMDDCLVRAATTASSLETEQDSGNIDKTQSKATPNEPSSSGTSSSGGPKRQETMGDTTAQTWSENVSKLSNDPLLARVLALETINTTQAKRIEKKDRKRTHKLKRLYKVGLTVRVESSDDEDDEDMLGVNEVIGDEGGAAATELQLERGGNYRQLSLTDVEMTLAQALAELKSAKPKATTITTTPTLTTTATTNCYNNYSFITRPRAKMDCLFYKRAKHLQPYSLFQTKNHHRLKLKLIISWLKDYKMKNKEQFTDAEKARLFEQFLEKRRKHFAAKRAEENRNRPSIRAQQRSIMYTYLKNMEGWKPKSLKNKTKLVEESSKKEEAKIAHESSLKRAGEELEQESSKKQKLEEDKESEELKKCLENKSDDGDE
ncbi:uncharacterized mitochondrial protein-like protein [Tanacetum coccineum]